MSHPRQGPTPECLIVVVNEILGTRDQAISPQTAEEAVDSHGLVKPAADWLIHHRDDDGSPIAVSIQYGNGLVLVHWQVTGDPDAARAAMLEALGTWRASQ